MVFIRMQTPALKRVGRESGRRFLPRRRAPFTVHYAEARQIWQGIDLSFQGMLCRPSASYTVIPEYLEIDLGGPTKTISVKVASIEQVVHRGSYALRVAFDDPNDDTRASIALWMAETQTPYLGCVQ